MGDPNGSGVENPLVIDLIGIDPTTDALVLYLFEPRPWEASPERLEQLRQKVNAYVVYVRQHLLEDYPADASRPRHLELRCLYQPDPETLEYIEGIQRKLREHGLTLVVRVSAVLAPQ
jgi:hypothetical protein